MPSKFLVLLSRSEVVGLTGLSQQTLHQYIKSGKFPRGVLGDDRKLYFTKDAVMRWVNDRKSRTMERIVRYKGHVLGVQS